MLGFPFIFRGALDVRATEINEAMKRAASQALAALAKMDVPDSVSKAYGGQSFRFGREYLIPKPFDHRVLLWVAPAVADAAMRSGVARQPIADMGAYLRRLEAMLSRSREVMSTSSRRRAWIPSGSSSRRASIPRSCAPRRSWPRRGSAGRSCWPARPRSSRWPATSSSRSTRSSSSTRTARRSWPATPSDSSEIRRRHGMTPEDAAKQARVRNVFGPLMLDAGDADGVISGLTQSYSDTIRPALQILGTAPGVRRVSGLYILMLKDQTFFFADTTVNIDPTAEELAEIAILTADAVHRFDIEPRIAMISFSNFGSNTHARALKVKAAVELVKRARPDLAIDGEMQADYAVVPEMLEAQYPWATRPAPQRPDLLGSGGRQRRLQAGLAAGRAPRPSARSCWVCASPCTSSSGASTWPTSSTWPRSPSWTRRRRRPPAVDRTRARST